MYENSFVKRGDYLVTLILVLQEIVLQGNIIVRMNIFSGKSAIGTSNDFDDWPEDVYDSIETWVHRVLMNDSSVTRILVLHAMVEIDRKMAMALLKL